MSKPQKCAKTLAIHLTREEYNHFNSLRGKMKWKTFFVFAGNNANISSLFVKPNKKKRRE